jgi:hypothetical protein
MAEDRLAGAATDGARSLRLRTMDRAPASQSGFATAERVAARVGDVSASFVVRHRQNLRRFGLESALACSYSGSHICTSSITKARYVSINEHQTQDRSW